MTNRKPLDKYHREIEIGDVLKVYHFTGARRKRYYMHKQVVGYQPFGSKDSFYKVKHLCSLSDSYYSLHLNGALLDYIEIVSSIGANDFGERPKILIKENNDK